MQLVIPMKIFQGMNILKGSNKFSNLQKLHIRLIQ